MSVHDPDDIIIDYKLIRQFILIGSEYLPRLDKTLYRYVSVDDTFPPVKFIAPVGSSYGDKDLMKKYLMLAIQHRVEEIAEYKSFQGQGYY